MKAVITGATGAVGMALISEFERIGAQVLVLCRPDSKRNERIKTSALVRTAECDLSDIKNYKTLEEDRYDVFFHFGWMGTTGEARNDMFLQNKNIEYTLDAVELAHRFGCSVFVGAGSQAEYGRVEGKLSDTTPTDPETGYGMAKLCAGRMSRVMCASLGIKHIWARILSVYGPYDGDGSMVISTLKKMLRGEEPELTAGEQMWDYLYSKDAARALLALAERGRDGGVYCLGSGKAEKLRDYIRKMRDAVAPDCPLGLGKRPYDKNQVMYLCADITKLKEDTGFEPKINFEDGIARTASWVAEQMRK